VFPPPGERNIGAACLRLFIAPRFLNRSGNGSKGGLIGSSTGPADYRGPLLSSQRVTNEVPVDPMLSRCWPSFADAALDRIAVFVEDTEQPEQLRLARSMGLRTSGPRI